MPELAEYCEVRTTGGIYRDWTSVLVRWSVDQRWMRTFELTCAEPSAAAQIRLKPGDRVDIALAGKVVIQEGYIRVRQAAYDAQRHAVQVSGYSKAGPINDASIEIGSGSGGGGQFRNYTLDQIANAVLKPFGIKFRLQNAPDGASEKFPNVIVRHGETPAELIGRLARQRGVWVTADKSGDLIGGAPGSNGSATLEEGRNILAANVYIEQPGVDSIVGRSQQAGSDSLFGRKAAEVSAKASVTDADSGKKRIIVAEAPLSQKELQSRVNMEAQELAAAILRVGVTHQGWMKPGATELWEIADQADVLSPMLFPVEGGRMNDLRVWGVTYAQETNAGTTTTVELVNRGAFSARFADGSSSDGFGLSAKPAEPEST